MALSRPVRLRRRRRLVGRRRRGWNAALKPSGGHGVKHGMHATHGATHVPSSRWVSREDAGREAIRRDRPDAAAPRARLPADKATDRPRIPRGSSRAPRPCATPGNTAPFAAVHRPFVAAGATPSAPPRSNIASCATPRSSCAERLERTSTTGHQRPDIPDIQRGRRCVTPAWRGRVRGTNADRSSGAPRARAGRSKRRSPRPRPR